MVVVGGSVVVVVGGRVVVDGVDGLRVNAESGTISHGPLLIRHANM